MVTSDSIVVDPSEVTFEIKKASFCPRSITNRVHPRFKSKMDLSMSTNVPLSIFVIKPIKFRIGQWN